MRAVVALVENDYQQLLGPMVFDMVADNMHSLPSFVFRSNVHCP